MLQIRGVLLPELLAQARVSHGYTLSTWGTGILLIGRFGVPGVWQVVMFVAGSAGGYIALGAGVGKGQPTTVGVPGLNVASRWVGQLAPCLLVLLAGHLVATGLPRGGAWLIAGVANTFVFFVAAAIQVAVMQRWVCSWWDVTE